MTESEEQTARTSRVQAYRRKALTRPDSDHDAQMYFDIPRGHTVLLEKGRGWRFLTSGLTGHDRKWTVRDARTDEHLGEITHGTKLARMGPGGRYINLEDVPDSIRVQRERRGICPSCQREEATKEPERDLTLFVSPDETDGWVECDQGRGHRYPISEVLIRNDQ